jgi:hypothetical protein
MTIGGVTPQLINHGLVSSGVDISDIFGIQAATHENNRAGTIRDHQIDQHGEYKVSFPSYELVYTILYTPLTLISCYIYHNLLYHIHIPTSINPS